MSDGVWVKVHPEDAGSAPGAAVINDAASNYDSKDSAVVIDGKTYDIYTFTDDTRNDMTLTVDTPGIADILIVGGGGPGGSNQNSGQAAGGGGGGGVLTTVIGDEAGRGTQGETSIVPRYLNKGVYEVDVGSGGAATAWTSSPAANGDATAFGALFVAYGGGRGRTVRNGDTWVSANNGASGGGGGGLGMDFQGFDSAGDGGGGAGSESSGNTGGNGVVSNITGSPVTYGAGGSIDGAGTAASPNTGNGGSNGNPGGNGGSGIVIVRVEV